MACIGTTATTAVDPLAQMADLAERHGMWLHVDAAMAGTAMVLPECRVHWAGVERADSLVFNPHKWMGVGFDFSAYYVRDPEHLIRVMSTNPSYLRTKQDGAVKNYRDWHVQLGRRFRSLKLWFYLMDVGVEGLQARLRRDLANAQWFKEQVDAASDWERLAPVPFQTICIRHVPHALAGNEDALSAPQSGVGAAHQRRRKGLPHALGPEGEADPQGKHRRRGHGARRGGSPVGAAEWRHGGLMPVWADVVLLAEYRKEMQVRKELQGLAF